MNFEIGQRYHGFVVDRVRRVDELDGQLLEMTHEQSGARLCWFDSPEENKLFSIAFKTLPQDSTGVFHILEHSVLCGSEKYPVREPFVELLKGSMNTFLNAMTFSDKTMYPVSSLNETDFLNLTEVYLDAVFAPAILKNPCIFQQEGWHIEWAGGDAAPAFKGVVFNEMKGAMSSVDEVMEQQVLTALFPDSCYGYNSGGEPAEIPDLTYEQFLASYRKYYHPENSYIWLDGAIPAEKTFALIDGYLSRFTRQGSIISIAPQRVLPAAAFEKTYEISRDEDPAEKTHLMLCKLFSDYRDKVGLYGVGLLSSVLCSGNDTPIKRALLDEGLCQDVSLSTSDGIFQEAFELWVRNTDPDKIPRIREVVRETAQKLVRDGIDREELRAAINRLAFRLKEPNEPQGLIRAINALNSWLYGGDPLLYLTSDDVIAALREKLSTRWYEELLEKLLLKEDDMRQLTLLPDPELGEKTRAAEEKRLAAVMSAMTDKQKRALIDQNARLLSWQQTPDTPEQLATLPSLPISAVSPKPDDVDTLAEDRSPVTVLYHRVPCGDIVHARLYFSLAGLDLPSLARLAPAADMFAELPTARHSVTDLQRLIRLYTGALDFTVEVTARTGHNEAASPWLVCSLSCLKEYLPQAADLVREILLETDFTQENLVKELILQADDDARQSVVMAGNRYGTLRALAHYSAAGAAAEAVSGVTAVRFLRVLARDENARAAMPPFVQQTLRDTVCLSRLTLSLSSGGQADPDIFLSRFPLGTPCPAESAYRFDGPMREGILIPAQISFASAAGSLAASGLQYNGTAAVLSNILTYAYLWNTVRVQGGAYGVSGRISPSGSVTFSSYRDPDASRSLNAFAQAEEYVRSFVQSDEDLTRFIISTIGQLNPLATPRVKGLAADLRWLSGITISQRRKERLRMIDMTRQELLDWLPALRQATKQGAVCAVGYREVLEKCGGLVIQEL